ncbi:MAG: ATP-binding protein [Oscillospiraceae bacterium]|nr:ATP-binding protein [Oscillospiraceae bacterium]MDY3258480.1 ATP-binding protein [Ruminococcus callidus]
MERKITLNLFYMGLFSAFIAIILTGCVFHEAFKIQLQDNLKTEGKIIAKAYYSLDSEENLSEFSFSGFRITLIDKDGNVKFDSNADVSEMNNHLNRPEIQQALNSGYGSYTRYSDTLKTEDYYYAMLLDDGNILRVSIAASSVFADFEKVIPIVAVILIILMFFAVIFSVILSGKILNPLKKMLTQLDDPDITSDPKKVYPELVPIVKEIQVQRSKQENMRQEFTANVSHELKTPLTSISGYAEIIETGMAKGDDVTKFAGKIRHEAKRMLVLISDIIKLSKLDADEIDLTEDIDLSSIVDEVCEHLQDSADKLGIRIFREGSSEIFKGNSTEIYELVYNLVDNAIKYNRPNGSIKIALENKKLTVADTGIGISEKDQKRMFERFYRADKSRSRATGGTGLGLSICKHVAEHHRAKILVESTLNVGTTFSISFWEN